MIEAIKNFLFLFIFPQPEYTILNTSFYAIGFVLASYLFFMFLKRVKISVDEKFATSISPFILLGSCLRVLEDLGILKSIFFMTPLIYLTIGFFLVLVLLISLFLEKIFQISYSKSLFFFGFSLSVFILSILLSKVTNFYAATLVLIFLLPWLIFLKFFKWKKENKFVFFIHIFDATVTFVGINYFGYKEMHVIPNFLITIFSPISFIFFKAIAIFSILIFLDKCGKEKEVKNFIKLMIGILGASTSIRDFFRILILV